MHRPHNLFFILCLLISCCPLQAQQQNQLPTVRIDTVVKAVALKLYGEVSCNTISTFDTGFIKNPGVPFYHNTNLAHFLREKECFNRLVFFRCHLVNPSAKELHFRFFPGFYYKHTRLFKYYPDTKKIVEVKDETPEDPEDLIRIQFSPGENCLLSFTAITAKTNNLGFSPQLIAEDYTGSYLKMLRFDQSGGTAVGYLCTGILLQIFLFSLFSFIESKKTEFLLYSGYALSIALLFFIKTFNFHRVSSFCIFEEELLDFLLQLTGHIFALQFIARFLDTKNRFQHVYKVILTAVGLLLCSFFAFLISYLLDADYRILALIENSTKYAFLALGLFFILTGSVYFRDPLFRYILYGNSILLVMGLASQLIVNFVTIEESRFQIFRDSMFYYELGITFELGFFLLGLVNKNYRELTEKIREQERLKAENQRKELEKQFAVYTTQQEERNRISEDMHDEFGAGMTTIRLLSEIAMTKSGSQPLPEVQKISTTANDLVGKLNAIIWSMSTSNDSLTNTIAYIKKFAFEYLENTNIRLYINSPHISEDQIISGEKRRNIFLCVKEALNNIVKHSGASEVSIRFEVNLNLRITISDNGRGINPDKELSFGNGMINMKKRMKKINGECVLHVNNGVSIQLVVPI